MFVGSQMSATDRLNHDTVIHQCVSSKLHGVIPEEADFCLILSDWSPKLEFGPDINKCVTHIVRMSMQRYMILTASCGHLSQVGF